MLAPYQQDSGKYVRIRITLTVTGSKNFDLIFIVRSLGKLLAC